MSSTSICSAGLCGLALPHSVLGSEVRFRSHGMLSVRGWLSTTGEVARAETSLSCGMAVMLRLRGSGDKRVEPVRSSPAGVERDGRSGGCPDELALRSWESKPGRALVLAPPTASLISGAPPTAMTSLIAVSRLQTYLVLVPYSALAPASRVFGEETAAILIGHHEASYNTGPM